MKKLFPYLLIAMLLTCVAGVAGAVVYPPGPGGTCPDTMTIINVEDPTQLCHPASSDTVYGVRGVVTAIDSIPGAYGFYMQLQGGGAWSGIDVFTGATNYQAPLAGTPTGGNLFYGDLIAVDGRSLDFNGLTEMTDFDNVQSTNDIIIRRISAHNPFPPFHVGTCLELDWVPGWPNANQEPWEGCLVKVRGPLVCGRTVGTGVGSRSMLVTTPGGADTIAVDGFSLTNVAALAVGAPIDSVQGVLSTSLISGITSYRILLRNNDDLFAAAPPNVIDAYCIQEGVVRVIFDRAVTAASAEDVANYSLQTFTGTVLSASLEPAGKSVLVEIDGAANHGDAETITVSGVFSTSNIVMTGAQPRTFINGVLSCAEINAPDATGTGLAGTPCRDHSRYTVAATGAAGTRVTYTGVAVANFGTLYHLQDPAGGLRSALPVFSPPAPLVAGHEYVIAGQIQEFDGISTSIAAGFTEGVNTQYVNDLGTAAIPAPVVQTIHVLSDTTCDAAQTLTNSEDYEGMLVTVRYVRVTEQRTDGQSFIIAGPNPTFSPDTMLVSNQNSSYSVTPDSAHTVSVTGLLNFRNGNLPWRISPRSNADIVDHGLNKLLGVGPADNGSDDLRLAVSPNPAHTARVSFTVPRSGKVDLGVYDLAGRRLVTLLSAVVPAGEYTKYWNGVDAGGNRSRSGVYFYKLKVGDRLITTRAIMLE
jgi:hypothetical protein